MKKIKYVFLFLALLLLAGDSNATGVKLEVQGRRLNNWTFVSVQAFPVPEAWVLEMTTLDCIEWREVKSWDSALHGPYPTYHPSEFWPDHNLILVFLVVQEETQNYFFRLRVIR